MERMERIEAGLFLKIRFDPLNPRSIRYAETRM